MGMGVCGNVCVGMGVWGGNVSVCGNVWEWVQDCWHDSYQGAPANGQAWEEGGNCHERVLRGGSWNDRPRYLRAAYRVKDYASGRQIFRGFRVARSL